VYHDEGAVAGVKATISSYGDVGNPVTSWQFASLVAGPLRDWRIGP